MNIGFNLREARIILESERGIILNKVRMIKVVDGYNTHFYACTKLNETTTTEPRKMCIQSYNDNYNQVIAELLGLDVWFVNLIYLIYNRYVSKRYLAEDKYKEVTEHIWNNIKSCNKSNNLDSVLKYMLNTDLGKMFNNEEQRARLVRNIPTY